MTKKCTKCLSQRIQNAQYNEELRKIVDYFDIIENSLSQIDDGFKMSQVSNWREEAAKAVKNGKDISNRLLWLVSSNDGDDQFGGLQPIGMGNGDGKMKISFLKRWKKRKKRHSDSDVGETTKESFTSAKDTDDSTIVYETKKNEKVYWRSFRNRFSSSSKRNIDVDRTEPEICAEIETDGNKIGVFPLDTGTDEDVFEPKSQTVVGASGYRNMKQNLRSSFLGLVPEHQIEQPEHHTEQLEYQITKEADRQLISQERKLSKSFSVAEPKSNQPRPTAPDDGVRITEVNKRYTLGSYHDYIKMIKSSSKLPPQITSRFSYNDGFVHSLAAHFSSTPKTKE